MAFSKPCSFRAPYCTSTGLRSCTRQRRRPAAATIVASAQATEVSWDEVLQKTADAPLNGYTVRGPGTRPSTAPNRVLETSPDNIWSAGIDEKHPVLLIRDTEAWCPFCERVWLALEWKGIDYDTMLINLRDKPDWFLELVPTGLVPVAKIRDQLIHESYDILRVLEDQFPEPTLLPKEADLRAEALKICEECDDFASAGYAFMTGGRMGSTSNGKPEPSQQELRTRFEERVSQLEQLLAKCGGPYILGRDLSLADVMYVSSLERFAAMMPVARAFNMRGNPAYPRLDAWYQAMDKLPAYQKVKSDDRTLQLLIRKVFGVKDRQVGKVSEYKKAARLEAAAKLGKNHSVILDDILRNSGILRVRSNQYGGTLRAFNGYPLTPGPALVQAVDHALRRVCHQLIHGNPGDRHDCKEACAIGSAALVFFRNRASAPRDLSAAATTELREACSEVLHDMF